MWYITDTSAEKLLKVYAGQPSLADEKFKIKIDRNQTLTERVLPAYYQ